jgi:glycosyltransferase involved in cell wall biosynthesis
VPRVLLVYSRRARFVEIDRDLLREFAEVREWGQPGRYANPAAVARAVAWADVVVGWFASWHTFAPVTLASALRKPTLMIVGGFDTASLPGIGYGYQQGGIARPLSRWIMRRATQLLTNSEYSRGEIERNVGIPADRVDVVYHGLPDPFGELPLEPRERLALTVANVGWLTYERKGLRPFVEASRLLPDVEFVVAGEWLDGAVDLLREQAGDNVTFTGRVPEVEPLFRRASVYVQASRHEGFGLAVAEAMLAGCVPVVTGAGALPEVVGDVGVRLERGDAESVAAGIEQGLASPEETRLLARRRVLTEFPLERRRVGLRRAVERLLPRDGPG